MTTDPPDRNGTPSSDTRHKEGQPTQEEILEALMTNPAAARLMQAILEQPEDDGTTYQITTTARTELYATLCIDSTTALLLMYFRNCQVDDIIDPLETAMAEWTPVRLFELERRIYELAKAHPAYDAKDDPHVLP
jgi:hypothetical protein